MQFLNPGPKTFAGGSALLLGCVLYVLVVLSPHREVSRRLSVLALSSAGKWFAGGTPEAILVSGTCKLQVFLAKSSNLQAA